MPCADLPGRIQALLRVRRRHADIDQGDVRMKIANAREQRVAVAHLIQDFDVVVGEQPGAPLADQGRVVGDYDAHGIDALTTVPRPGSLSITSRVSSASRRSLNPANPESASTRAPPTPLSATMTRSTPPFRSSSTDASVVDACFTTFVSASATRK